MLIYTNCDSIEKNFISQFSVKSVSNNVISDKHLEKKILEHPSSKEERRKSDTLNDHNNKGMAPSTNVKKESVENI